MCLKTPPPGARTEFICSRLREREHAVEGWARHDEREGCCGSDDGNDAPVDDERSENVANKRADGWLVQKNPCDEAREDGRLFVGMSIVGVGLTYKAC